MEPRLQFYQEWINAVTSRCFPHSILSLASRQTLKELKRSQGHQRGVRRVDLANWALRTSPKFPQGLNITSIRVFHQIRDPEIPITLRILSFFLQINEKFCGFYLSYISVNQRITITTTQRCAAHGTDNYKGITLTNYKKLRND